MNSPRGVKSGQSEHFLPHMWHPSRFTTNNWKTLICYIHVIAVIFCSEDLFWFQRLYWSRDIPHGIFRLLFVIGEFAQGQMLCVFPNGLFLTMYSLPNYVLSSSLCTLVLTSHVCQLLYFPAIVGNTWLILLSVNACTTGLLSRVTRVTRVTRVYTKYECRVCYIWVLEMYWIIMMWCGYILRRNIFQVTPYTSNMLMHHDDIVARILIMVAIQHARNMWGTCYINMNAWMHMCHVLM